MSYLKVQQVLNCVRSTPLVKLLAVLECLNCLRSFVMMPLARSVVECRQRFAQ